MISRSLKIVLVLAVFIYIVFILAAVKKKKMRINYLIVWMFIGLALLIALLLPNFITFLSKLTGFELVINMLFSGAIFLIFLLIFDLTKQITLEQNKNVTLIQEISILKKRVEELEKKKED